MCPLLPEKVALPAPGSQGIELTTAVPVLGAYLNDPLGTMLLPDDEVNWTKYHEIRPFGVPELKEEKTRLQLALRMWVAGMLVFVKEAVEFVSVFSVVKKVEEEMGKKQITSRLVWDLRRVNQRFRKPPWVPMGSPALLGHLELSDDVLQGRKLYTFQGDVPDFFYLLRLPGALHPYFCLEGVTPLSLQKFARQNGVEINIPAGMKAVATAVNPMGFSWAVFLAHTTLEAALDEEFAEDDFGKLSCGRPLENFVEKSLLYWLFIDDYAGAVLGKDDEDGNFLTETLGTRAREALVRKGLRVHKEAAGKGLDKCLGITIDPETLIARVAEARLKQTVLITEALSNETGAFHKDIQRLMGQWAWILLLARPGFAIPDRIYAWLGEHDGEKLKQDLWPEVRGELASLAAMSVFFFADLRLGWLTTVFMTDASLQGYAAVHCQAELDEIRPEARWAAQRAWTARMEKLYTDIEHDAAGEGMEEEMEEPDCDRSSPGFLELFSGGDSEEGGRLSSAVSETTGSWTERWDILNGPGFDLLDKHNLSGLLWRVRAGQFWMVHLGPPCSTFSRARLPSLRSNGHPWGIPGLSKKEKEIVNDGSLMCLVAVEVAKRCLEAGVGFSLENPATSMMWVFPPMQEFLEKAGVIVVTLDYCQFGEEWRTSTKIMTNVPELIDLGRRCSGRGVCSRTRLPHQVLRGMAPCGLPWTRVACAYPKEMCKCFAELILHRAPGQAGPSTGAAKQQAADTHAG